MKFPAIGVLLLLPFSVLAQLGLIQGTVVNEKTNESLPFTSIYLKEDGSGTIANAAGNFSLRLHHRSKATLVVSYLGYATKTVSIHASDTSRHLTILLEPKTVHLGEVAVRSETPLSVVKKSIARFSENYPSRSYTAVGFQREYVKSESNDFIQLLEAHFTTSGTSIDHSSKMHLGKYIEDKAEKGSLWSPSRGGFYTFGWADISGIKAPDKKNFLGIDTDKNAIERYYDFAWNDKELIGNTYVIQFDQKKNVKRALLKGRLYIDEESLAIVKLSYELSPHGARWLKPHETWGNIPVSQLPKKITIKKDHAEISYRKVGSKWYLNSLITDASFNASLVFFGIVQGEKNGMSFHSECVVNTIDTITQGANVSNIQKIGSIPTPQNFIKKEFESYENQTQQWTDFNFIQADTSFSSIAAALKIKNRQWELERQKRLAEKQIYLSFNRRELQEDLHYLKETLEKVHPGLNRYTSKAVLEWQFYAAAMKLERGTTEAGVLNVLGPLVESIHCGHTVVYPSVARTEWLSLSHTAFPIRLSFIGDTAIVTSPFNEVPVGSRLLSINGTAVGEIISKLKSVIPADGWNETYKAFQLEKDFSRWLTWYYPNQDSFDITFEKNKVVHHKRINGIGLSIPQDKSSAHFEFYDSISVLRLTLPTFEASQAFEHFLDDAFKQAKQKQTKNLIIDLRNNEGGRDEYGALLFSFISRDNFDYYKSITVKTTDTTILNRLVFDGLSVNKILPGYNTAIRKDRDILYYDAHSNLQQQSPNENAFQGEVYIFINGGTFSTAAEFASIAKSNHRAIFIGEESGGAYHGNCSLGTPTLTLPNSKIRINIPLGMYTMAINETQPPDHGVIPDHQVIYTTHDLLAGRDKEMELCMKIIGTRH